MFKTDPTLYNIPVAVHIIDSHNDNNTIVPAVAINENIDDPLTDFEPGLRKVIEDSSNIIDTRYWVVDNSGSMLLLDGSIIDYKNGENIHRKVSRFDELCDTIKTQAKIAAKLHAKTVFYPLNKPYNFNMDKIEVVDEIGLFQLNQFCDTTYPNGLTPLCATLTKIIEDIRSKSDDLRLSNKKVIVVIATDGESSDGNIAVILNQLKSLPCESVIIRLCTDDNYIKDYWNSVDKELELDLDVIDDLYGEAAQIHKVNPWLTYTSNIQTCREWGTCIKLFDLLDERTFSISEIYFFSGIILGSSANLLNPNICQDEFISSLNIQINKLNKVYNPLTKKLCPIINDLSLPCLITTPFMNVELKFNNIILGLIIFIFVKNLF